MEHNAKNKSDIINSAIMIRVGLSQFPSVRRQKEKEIWLKSINDDKMADNYYCEVHIDQLINYVISISHRPHGVRNGNQHQPYYRKHSNYANTFTTV